MTESVPDAATPASNLKGKKILWVEDDQFLQNIISHKLGQEDVVIKYAQEGQGALDLAVSEKADIIVLDILLPGIDGVEVLRQLRANPATQAIPVIMFSNVDDKARMEESQKLGVRGFFVKTSMTMEEIIAEINKALTQ